MSTPLPIATPAALDEDLSSVRRVRNRLASSPDAALPRILSALLPRLLRKMDGNYAGIADHRTGDRSSASEDRVDEEREEISAAAALLRLRRSIHDEYEGLIDHAVDRIDGNPDLDAAPFTETVADFVASSCAAGYERYDMPQTKTGECEAVTTAAACWPYRKKSHPSTIGSDCGFCLSEQPGFKAALRILRAGMVRLATAQGGMTRRNAVMSALKASIMSVEDLHWEKKRARRHDTGGGVDANVDADVNADGDSDDDSDVDSDTDDGTDDRAHAGARVGRVPNNSLSTAQRSSDPWIDASWLALDSIALLFGVRPIGMAPLVQDPEKEGAASLINAASPCVKQDESKWPSLQHQSMVSSIAPLTGDGTYHLFLDLILFQPNSPSGGGGLSRLGATRMRAPALDFETNPSHSDWVELKIAALELAVGSRKGEGTLDWKDDANDDRRDSTAEWRALVLLVLSSPKRGCSSRDVNTRKLERMAGSRLRSHLDQGRVLARGDRSRKKKARRGGGRKERSGTARCESSIIVHAVTSLLCLVLGSANATVVLQRHSEESGRSDDGQPLHITLGMTVSADVAADTVRSPLAPQTACVVLNFATDRLQIQKHVGTDVGTDSSVLVSPAEPVMQEEVALLANLSLAAALLVLQLYEPNDALRRAMLAQSGWGDGSEGPPACASGMLRTLAAWLEEARRCAAKEPPPAGPMSGGHMCMYDRWLDDICRRTFDVASKFVRSDVLPALVDGSAPMRRDGGGVEAMEHNVDDDDAAPRVVQREAEIPRRLRGRIVAQQRVQRWRRARLVPPVEIQRACAEVIRGLAKHVVPRSANDSEDGNGGPARILSFDVPILLLNWLVLDDAVAPHIAVALGQVLRAYKSVVGAYRCSLCGTSEEAPSPHSASPHSADFLVQSVAPLLPVLLTASTSDSHIARESAVKWTSDIVRCLDRDAAAVLCAYLVADSDTATAKAASDCIRSIKLEEDDDAEHGENVVNTTDSAAPDGNVLFLDSNGGIDRELLYARLYQDIHRLARELSTTEDAAATLLQSHRFSRDQVVEDIRCSEDLERTLDRCGVRWRCRSLLRGNEGDGGGDVDSSKIQVDMCGICYDDDLSDEEMYALPCGHGFCRDCFGSFLQVRFEDPRSLLRSTCPQQGCNEQVADVDVEEFGPEKLDAWKKYRFESFVNESDGYRWCPGAGCSMVAISETGAGSAAKCTSCKTRFCFKCGAEPHSPADCSDLGDFMQLFKSSEYWIKKHAKRCPNPNCKVPIEKNTGCNHMTCTSCRTHFCWICVSIIGEDGNLNRHVCNRYDPRAEWSEKRRNEFYLSRFEACVEGEKFARIGLGSLTKKSEQMADEDSPFVDLEDFGVLVEARQTLVDILNFLKWTYAIAWALRPAADAAVPTSEGNAFSGDEASVFKDLFECHQATLEVFAEKLSSLTELNLEELHTTGGERRFRMHFRSLAFHTRVLNKYRERMIKFLDRSGAKRKKDCRK